MPINPSALGDTPQDPPQPPEEGKRKRRTKVELIADAVVPGNNDQVELKDAGTGAKIERPWLVAVEMIRDGKAEFADKAMKYSMLKYDEQKAAAERADKTQEREPDEHLTHDAQGQPKSPHIPPDAKPGDEVVINGEKFRVGHGGVLTTSPVLVDPPAASTPVTNGNGSGDAKVETLPAGVQVEQVSEGTWKVGTGILEKIGLPDYSSLQIGPISASRTTMDDGRRTTVMIGDREAQIPTTVVEVAREAMDIVEYIARYQRGELVSFLESTGALKQPVS